MTDIDQSNASFWNDLCGSALARKLGVSDASIESLGRYDRWYFEYYPYLLPFVDVSSMAGKRVLEVGLGYGSLSQTIAESGAIYSGLDIASGPVDMVNHRLRQNRLRGRAVQGNVLRCPFDDQSFDVAVAIGSLHHTGNLSLALRELHRCVVPGGSLIFMVYNALSYRQWLRWPLFTFRHLLWSRGRSTERPTASEGQRFAYDADEKGNAAPETDFIAQAELPELLPGWQIEKVELHNVGYEGPLRFLPRKLKLSMLDGLAGLDLYVRATRI